MKGKRQKESQISYTKILKIIVKWTKGGCIKREVNVWVRELNTKFIAPVPGYVATQHNWLYPLTNNTIAIVHKKD